MDKNVHTASNGICKMYMFQALRFRELGLRLHRLRVPQHLRGQPQHLRWLLLQGLGEDRRHPHRTDDSHRERCVVKNKKKNVQSIKIYIHMKRVSMVGSIQFD